MEDTGTHVDPGFGESEAGAPAEGQPSQHAEEGASQPAETAESGQNFDQVSAQADYTRKTQELAEQRKEVQRLQDELTQSLNQIRSGQGQQGGYNQGYNPYGAQTPAGYGQQYPNPAQYPGMGAAQGPMQAQEYMTLVDQIGEQGAQSVASYINKIQGEINNAMLKQNFANAYAAERNKFASQYGEEAVRKHDYLDPQTGAIRNRVVDLRAAGVEDKNAWNAYNSPDPKSLEQELRDKIYSEMNTKASKTPAAQNSSQPGSRGPGAAMSIEDAFAQAEEAHKLHLD